MKKLILFAGFLCFASMASQLHAQTINNRNWKAFIADPINDTLTLHIHSDSSFVSNSKGEIMIRTNATVDGDTLTLSDSGTGEHDCPDKGKYKINLSGNVFTLHVISDACEGRAQVLEGLKWTEVTK